MKKKIKIVTLLLIVAYYGDGYAQMDQYAYKTKLNNITDTWHKIGLPNEMFSKISPNLSDVRVFGITPKNDTIEAPYVLRLQKEKASHQTIPFTILNTTYNKKGSYITLGIPNEEPINQIQLDFNQSNFDWMITLEGSQDQTQWYTITENYRILSIKNELTDYQFSTVKFSTAQYRYFRILIKSNQKPVLESATITKKEKTIAEYQEYPIKHINIQNVKKTKQTVIDVKFSTAVPVSYIQIAPEDTFDYYRPISIEYVSDSIQTSQGKWVPQYHKLSSGVLNSIEDNVFICSSTITQKLRILIKNHDNQPLQINKINIKGYKHELVTRFISPATYYLVYGNDKVQKPLYDLNHVSAKIPQNISNVTLGKQEKIEREVANVTEPLFVNKYWLWGVMLVVILLLGGFTLSMMKKK
ncbi:DUF3999 family protein [Aquimarina longa]|uniref:DUF3999 family protein n=1 Tax=Aquimarina longa TaxID=1080221 RepID=UPI0007864EE1|nr:DUF3999 family protein [Aquimarina longa]